jgi:diguanylate cyclase (GGDEF)-like protein/PAS domain S-box-containing protein
MVKQCDDDNDWKLRRERIIGLGDRSIQKSYYPQLRLNMERLERFHTLLDQTSDNVVLITLPDGVITDVNAATARLVGSSVNALIGKSVMSLGLDGCGDILEAMRVEVSRKVAASDLLEHSSIIKFDQNNQCLWLDLRYRTAVLDGGYYGVMVARDVTERIQNHQTLTELLAEKEALLDNALVGLVWIRDRCIISCNRRFEEMFGFVHGEVLGQSTLTLYQGEDSFTAFGTEAYRALSNGERFMGTVILNKVSGESFWCDLTGNAIDPSNPQGGSVWIFTDVNEHKLALDKALFLSHHDSLTRLPNHQLLADRLQQAIVAADNSSTHNVVALINLDLDRFKTINDSLGYTYGNELLVQIAQRLSGCLQDKGTVSRQGGDEFLLLLPNLPDPDSCVTLLGQILERVQQPFVINEQELAVSVSVGIAMYPEDGTNFDTLLNKSDIAMYQAKEAGRNTYRFFNESMNKSASEQITTTLGLRKALELGQFVLYYQPQVEISTGRLVGAEALIRWQHPELGLIPPIKFIPVAEDTGLIVPMGEWVLQEACREVAKWAAMGLHKPVVAVNLSALQFARGDIETSVFRAIDQAGIAPDMLELELTESIMMKDTENVLATVKRLKLMGCKLAIDDFGTGYSSLAYLTRFSVDKLKIDQAFIRELANNQDDAVIVRAVIQLAKSLGLKTIAEGIESQQIMDLLRLFHCDEAQGYFLGRPMPAEQFMQYLSERI